MGVVGGRSYVGVRVKEGWREWRRGGKKGVLMIGSPPPLLPPLLVLFLTKKLKCIIVYAYI